MIKIHDVRCEIPVEFPRKGIAENVARLAVKAGALRNESVKSTAEWPNLLSDDL